MGESNICVLIGCNEPAVTESLKLVLADRSHVTGRTRCDEVVQEASVGHFDAVILCANSITPLVCSSGGVLGSATCTIKAIKAARAVPIVILSTMSEWRDDLIAAGADVFMAMPLNVAEFTAAVDRTSP